MKRFGITLLIILLIAAALLGFGYRYKTDISRLVQKIPGYSQPCQKPITYSIANLDSRFGVTNEELLLDIQRAEQIWESPINKPLFEYSPTGDLKISFVYDNRQKATDALKKLGITMKDDRSTYDTLKTKYNALMASYNREKKRIAAMIATYTADKTVFEAEVAQWNSRGGAPKAEYLASEQKRAALNSQVAVINQAQDALNKSVDTIYAAETVLNKLVNTLNLQVATYNNVGISAGKQFNEGEYVRDANGTAIHIFQFNDTNQLVRVLAHELGHALGLEHLDNPKAIMYYLNEGLNEKLTADDEEALKKICGLTSAQ